MVRSITFRLLLLLTWLVVLGLSGCSKKPSAKARNTDNTSAPATPAADYSAYGQTPTDEECQKFADAFEEVVRTGDVAAANALMDGDSLISLACTGIDGTADSRKGFARGIQQGIDQHGSAIVQIVNSLGTRGNCRFLRLQEENGQKWGLFRCLSDGDELSYYKFVLRRQKDGRVQAVDILPFTTGETISRTMHRFFTRCVAEDSRSALAKLTQGAGDYAKSVSQIEEIAEHVRANRNQQALDLFEKLPDSVKKDKSILLMRVRAASQLDDQQYDAAVQEFGKNYPNDPCLDLLSVNSYFVRKQFAKGRAAINRLDKAVGGDPYLNVLRANFYLEEGKYEKAGECARKAADAEKDLVPAHWAQVAIALRAKDFAETARVLDVLQKALGIEMGDLTAVPEYAEFVKSPEYIEWVGRQK